MRGHWLDRLAEIDADIEDMKKAATPQTNRPRLAASRLTSPPRTFPNPDFGLAKLCACAQGLRQAKDPAAVLPPRQPGRTLAGG